MDLYLKGEQTGVDGDKPRQPARKPLSHIRGENKPLLTRIERWPSNNGDKFDWSEADGSDQLWSCSCGHLRIRC